MVRVILTGELGHERSGAHEPEDRRARPGPAAGICRSLMPGDQAILVAGRPGAGKTSTHRHVLPILARRRRDTPLTLPQAMTTTVHLHLVTNPAAQAAAVLAWCDEAISFAERVTERARAGGLTTHRWAEHFRAAQRQLRQWARTSPLPTVEIDTAQQRWDDYARQIAELLCSSAPFGSAEPPGQSNSVVREHGVVADLPPVQQARQPLQALTDPQAFGESRQGCAG